MKTASGATLAILNNSAVTPVKRCDCYTFALKNGTTLRWTDADIPVTVGGSTYVVGPTLSRTKTKQTADLNVDTIQLTIGTQGRGGDNTLINGKTLQQQILAGLFDNCTVTIQKLFLSSWTDTSPGLVPWFSGRMSSALCGLTQIVMTVAAMTELLNTQAPDAIYQTQCNNTFCDMYCTLLASNFATTGQTASGTITQSSFGVTGTSRADGYYTLGKVKFTSGANTGISRTVKSYLSNVVTVFKLFPYAINNGDIFTISRGCDKLQATCAGYGNQNNFFGYRFIPTPETAIGGGSSPGSVAAGGVTGVTVVGSSTTAKQGGGTYVA